MEKKYEISSVYLKEIVDQSARTLVGKICKRFEICDNPTTLKSEVKELIYENFRDMMSLLDAHQYGYEQKVWKFINTKGKE